MGATKAVFVSAAKESARTVHQVKMEGVKNSSDNILSGTTTPAPRAELPLVPSLGEARVCVRADENRSTMEGRLLPSNYLHEARLERTSLPNNHLPDVELVTTPTVNDPPADHFPTYPQVNSPCFKCGNIDGTMFQNAVNCT